MNIIIPPNSTVYVCSSFLSGDTQLLFELKIKASSAFSCQSIVIADVTSKNKSNKNTGVKFSVPISNMSDAPAYVNKTTILGIDSRTRTEKRKCKF